MLHTVKGIDLPLAATALTAYMLGSTAGVLVGGWFADSFKRHILLFVTGLTALSALLIPRVNWLSLPIVAIVAVILLASLFCAGSARVSARADEAVVQPAE